MELLSFLLVHFLKSSSQWIITPKDKYPIFKEEDLDKFIKHGFDSELGWTRKPNTDKEEIGQNGKSSWYYINDKGVRVNPIHEEQPSITSCYGDSFVFCRQVNDRDTFEWYLSELTQTNVLNFGVGNYGLDQALLRLKKEYPGNRTKIVIMGVVPSTIVRILSVWKHYNEFGNIYGFKPRFILEEDKLKLINNIIDTEDKFLRYKEFLPEINKYDYFYETKFLKEMFRFPYSLSILKDLKRTLPLLSLVFWEKITGKKYRDQPYPSHARIIMRTNLKLRVNLFTRNKEAVELLTKLVESFKIYSIQEDFTPVFLWMPQKDDILYTRKNNNYYKEFTDKLKGVLRVIDLTDILINYNDLDRLYCDDSHYGGHFSTEGNKLIAECIKEELRDIL